MLPEHRRREEAYGSVSLTGTDLITVNPGENVPFNRHGQLKNVKLISPSDTLLVRESGDYKVEFTLLIGGPASASVYGLFINNSLVKSELTNFGIQRQVSGANLELVGQAIIKIRKNSKINLKNIGTTPDVLISFLDGRKINAASLSIIKLN